MDDLNQAAERAAFEAWYVNEDGISRKFMLGRNSDGTYAYGETECMWEAWQGSAARRAAPVGEVELPALPKRWPERMAEYYNSDGSQLMRGTSHFKDSEIAELRALFASYVERIRVLENELRHAKLQEIVDIAQECNMGYGPSVTAGDAGAAQTCRSSEKVQAQSIDTPEFRELLDSYADADYGIAMGYERAAFDRDARAVKLIAYIDGRTAGAAPEGYVLVPVKPTAEMLKAGAESEDKDFGLIIHDVYCAMVNAAPSPQPGREGE